MEIMQIRDVLKPLVNGMKSANKELSEAIKAHRFTDTTAGYLEVSDPPLVAENNQLMTGMKAAEHVATIYSQIHYKRGFQHGRETVMAAGYLMVPSSIMSLAEVANEAKQAFSDAVIGLSDSPGMKNKHRRNQKVAEALSTGSDAGLCLQQAYRKIQALEEPVARLKWRWISKPSSKRVSREEGIELLENLKKHWPHNEALYDPQIRTLAALHKDAKLVRVLQEGSPTLKVTVGYEETKFTSTGSWYYPTLSAPLPILIPESGHAPVLSWPSIDREGLTGNYTGTRPSSRKEIVCPSINLWSSSGT